MQKLTYDNFEKLQLNKPVYRIKYFAQYCKNKCVLDLGSYDETAFNLKTDTDYWLFSVLEKNTKELVGIDIALPQESIEYKSASIFKKDVFEININFQPNLEIITAGEILEHLPSPSEFLKFIKSEFHGKELLLSTPNGLNFGNTLMGLIKREVQHIDHLHVFTYKTLNTLCERAEFEEWEIIPYHFFATEMKLKSKSKLMKGLITLIEKTINGVEFFFPLLSMGYMVKIKI
ncbi:MAG: methyltransferase domain-containing protein [Bacteroidales bacterium]